MPPINEIFDIVDYLQEWLEENARTEDTNLRATADFTPHYRMRICIENKVLWDSDNNSGEELTLKFLQFQWITYCRELSAFADLQLQP